MDFSFYDGKRLCSLLWNKEDLLQKKRRWLMQSEFISTADGGRKRPKRPKFMNDSCLPESYQGNEVVTSLTPMAKETVRSTVERSFGSFSNKESHLVVQDNLQPCNMHNMEITSVNMDEFSKTFFSIMDNLNDDALFTVANIVTNRRVSFKRTRSKMIKIIKDHLPMFLEEEDISSSVNQLSDILRKPGNFLEKHFKIGAPVSQALLTSINKSLERLHEMSFQDLNAMNRKLRGLSVVPQFPIARDTCKKDLLLKRVKRKCVKFLLLLKIGDHLPKSFAKALSVIHLFMKHTLKSMDIPEPGFFPFSPEVVRLQNDIIKALWLLLKVKHDKLKALQDIVDPKARVPTKTFRNALRKYFIEYLYECSEIKVPEEVMIALDMLSRRHRCQFPIFSEETREEEVGAVMNFSCQLRKFVVSLFPNSIQNEHEDASLEEFNSETDAFDLSGADYFNLGGYENSYCESGSNIEVEGGQHSRSAASTSFTGMGRHSIDLAEVSSKISDDNTSNLELECDDDTTINLNIKEPTNHSHQNTGSKTERSLEDISDETALVAYRLIGRMLDKLIGVEDKKANLRTRSYLNGGSSPSREFQVSGGFSSALNGDVKAHVLVEATQELVPLLPKRCFQRVENLMRVP